MPCRLAMAINECLLEPAVNLWQTPASMAPTSKKADKQYQVSSEGSLSPFCLWSSWVGVGEGNSTKIFKAQARAAPIDSAERIWSCVHGTHTHQKWNLGGPHTSKNHSYCSLSNYSFLSPLQFQLRYMVSSFCQRPLIHHTLLSEKIPSWSSHSIWVNFMLVKRARLLRLNLPILNISTALKILFCIRFLHHLATIPHPGPKEAKSRRERVVQSLWP